jgi:hypothetical protein
LLIILRLKYEKKSDKYLSFLIEKAFRYKKYVVARFLIEAGVHIRNYEDIFIRESDDLVSSSKLNRNS